MHSGISERLYFPCPFVGGGGWGQLGETRDEHVSLAGPRGGSVAAVQLLRLPFLQILCVLSHHLPNKQEGIKRPDWMGDPKWLRSHYAVINYPAAIMKPLDERKKGRGPPTGNDYGVTHFGSRDQINETLEIKCGH